MEIQKQFWMVYVDKRSSPTVKHETYNSAFEEATRLTKDPRNIGVKIYILRATGYFVQELAPVSFIKLD